MAPVLKLKLMSQNLGEGNTTEEDGRRDIVFLVVWSESLDVHFLLKSQQRDAATLIQIIQQYIQWVVVHFHHFFITSFTSLLRPGSVILSDERRAYSHLDIHSAQWTTANALLLQMEHTLRQWKECGAVARPKWDSRGLCTQGSSRRICRSTCGEDSYDSLGQNTLVRQISEHYTFN